MSRIGSWIGLSAAFVMLSSAARANDTTAELATGGLLFTVDRDITMRSEDLFVSTDEIRISYVFHNKSATDKTVTIAFPMPDVVGAAHDEPVGLPTENPDNLFHFRVMSNGRPVDLSLDQRIVANGVDQTARLRAGHIPLMPLTALADKALDGLSGATQAEFVKLGLAEVEEYSSKPDGPMEKHLTATWTLKTAFTWRQTFPAGSDVKLDQAYKPSVGGSAGTIIGGDGWRDRAEGAAYVKKYCVDSDIVTALTRAKAAKRADYPPFYEKRLAYILTTGANWAGPIGSFRLVVDKGAPGNLVSFCADGVSKIGPTQFEVRKTDFTPKQDLNILLLVPTE